jgi:hypothetical protein
MAANNTFEDENIVIQWMWGCDYDMGTFTWNYNFCAAAKTIKEAREIIYEKWSTTQKKKEMMPESVLLAILKKKPAFIYKGKKEGIVTFRYTMIEYEAKK